MAAQLPVANLSFALLFYCQLVFPRQVPRTLPRPQRLLEVVLYVSVLTGVVLIDPG